MEDAVYLNADQINAFCAELHRRERGEGTIVSYRHSLLHLSRAMSGGKLTREALLVWKAEITQSRAVRTVNCMIAAVNAFLEFCGAAGWKLKTLKCQRKIFSEDELSREEFYALVRQAEEQGDFQTAMLLRAMAGSGVRVSEVCFLTVEAIRQKTAVIRLKGKTREIPLGDALCRQLLRFATENHITSGPIFVGRGGRPLDRRRIWERMKKLCLGAGADPKKVHPHALRHLFARAFYDLTQDIAKLADLLGHSSIETTRIYIMTSIREHRTILNRLVENLDAKKPPQRSGKKRYRT